jgi:stage IV sporulation protein A
MVTTPWFDHEIPMTQAAELGTRKVISEHSTIGIVMTTDGTITDIPREDYEEAEARVIGELKSLGKPFLVLLNSAQPDSPQTQALRAQLAERYDVTCLAVDCLSLGEEDISNLLRSVLYEFPLGELDVFLPDWVEALAGNHPLKSELFSAIRGAAASLSHIRQVEGCVTQLLESPSVSGAQVSRLDLGTGVATLNLEVPRSLFYEALEAQSGFRVENDGALFSLLEELGKMKAEYDKVAPALAQVWKEGYGIVVPQVEELTVEEPEVTRQGGRYGVRLKASAPSIHLVRSVPKPQRRKNKNLLLTIVRGTPII